MNTRTKGAPPIPGAPFSDYQAWLDQRFGGITATEVRELAKGYARQRRELLQAKLNRTSVDLTGNRYVDHGNRREPIIGAWFLANFDIEPCELVYSSGDNPRHLASPDGVSLDFANDGITAEVKTSKHDLTPGEIVGNTLVLAQRDDGTFALDKSRHFASTGYYDQMQWQMHVMGGDRVLFVWEQHDDNWPDPKPLHDRPLWCWVLRDQQRIDELVEIADGFLKELDAARVSTLPPAAPAGVDPDVADLVHQLLTHRDAEAVAKSQKERVWKELQSRLIRTNTVDDDTKLELDDAVVTVSTTVQDVEIDEFDEDRMRAENPRLVAQYEALRDRYTTRRREKKSTTRLSVVARKKKEITE